MQTMECPCRYVPPGMSSAFRSLEKSCQLTGALFFYLPVIGFCQLFQGQEVAKPCKEVDLIVPIQQVAVLGGALIFWYCGKCYGFLLVITKEMLLLLLPWQSHEQLTSFTLGWLSTAFLSSHEGERFSWWGVFIQTP